MKFIHLADCHLSSTSNFEASKASLIRNTTWESFENILSSNRDVDFALIAGDLFERNLFTSKDFERLFGIFEDFSQDIYYVTGNHDYFDDFNQIFLNKAPNNLHIFTEDKLSMFEREDVRIYGVSYKDRINNYSFPYEIRLDRSYKNILLAHGDISPIATNYLNLNPDLLEKSGFDYVALGHIHQPISQGNIYYSSSIEPFNLTNLGEFGYILYDNGNISRINSSLMEFYNFTIDADDFLSEADLIDFINQSLGPKINFVNINISGDHDFSESYIKNQINATYTDIVVTKKSSYDDLIMLYPDSLLSKFVGRFEGLTDDISKRALELGIDAILRSKR